MPLSYSRRSLTQTVTEGSFEEEPQEGSPQGYDLSSRDQEGDSPSSSYEMILDPEEVDFISQEVINQRQGINFGEAKISRFQDDFRKNDEPKYDACQEIQSPKNLIAFEYQDFHSSNSKSPQNFKSNKRDSFTKIKLKSYRSVQDSNKQANINLKKTFKGSYQNYSQSPKNISYQLKGSPKAQIDSKKIKKMNGIEASKRVVQSAQSPKMVRQRLKGVSNLKKLKQSNQPLQKSLKSKLYQKNRFLPSNNLKTTKKNLKGILTIDVEEANRTTLQAPISNLNASTAPKPGLFFKSKTCKDPKPPMPEITMGTPQSQYLDNTRSQIIQGFYSEQVDRLRFKNEGLIRMNERYKNQIEISKKFEIQYKKQIEELQKENFILKTKSKRLFSQTESISTDNPNTNNDSEKIQNLEIQLSKFRDVIKNLQNEKQGLISELDLGKRRLPIPTQKAEFSESSSQKEILKMKQKVYHNHSKSKDFRKKSKIKNQNSTLSQKRKPHKINRTSLQGQYAPPQSFKQSQREGQQHLPVNRSFYKDQKFQSQKVKQMSCDLKNEDFKLNHSMQNLPEYYSSGTFQPITDFNYVNSSLSQEQKRIKNRVENSSLSLTNGFLKEGVDSRILNAQKKYTTVNSNQNNTNTTLSSFLVQLRQSFEQPKAVFSNIHKRTSSLNQTPLSNFKRANSQVNKMASVIEPRPDIQGLTETSQNSGYVKQCKYYASQPKPQSVQLQQQQQQQSQQSSQQQQWLTKKNLQQYYQSSQFQKKKYNQNLRGGEGIEKEREVDYPNQQTKIFKGEKSNEYGTTEDDNHGDEPEDEGSYKIRNFGGIGEDQKYGNINSLEESKQIKGAQQASRIQDTFKRSTNSSKFWAGGVGTQPQISAVYHRNFETPHNFKDNFRRKKRRTLEYLLKERSALERSMSPKKQKIFNQGGAHPSTHKYSKKYREPIQYPKSTKHSSTGGPSQRLGVYLRAGVGTRMRTQQSHSNFP